VTAPKALSRLTGPKKPGPSGDQRRTTCKLCLISILIGEPTVWLTKPMGLSHQGCAQRAGAAR
jgi:hypothetical protein